MDVTATMTQRVALMKVIQDFQAAKVVRDSVVEEILKSHGASPNDSLQVVDLERGLLKIIKAEVADEPTAEKK